MFPIDPALTLAMDLLHFGATPGAYAPSGGSAAEMSRVNGLDSFIRTYAAVGEDIARAPAEQGANASAVLTDERVVYLLDSLARLDSRLAASAALYLQEAAGIPAFVGALETTSAAITCTLLATMYILVSAVDADCAPWRYRAVRRCSERACARLKSRDGARRISSEFYPRTRFSLYWSRAGCNCSSGAALEQPRAVSGSSLSSFVRILLQFRPCGVHRRVIKAFSCNTKPLSLLQQFVAETIINKGFGMRCYRRSSSAIVCRPTFCMHMTMSYVTNWRCESASETEGAHTMHR